MNPTKLAIDDLASIESKPTEHEITLKTIADFYNHYMVSTEFEFTLDHSTQQTVKIRFEKDNLCHLLGFQHIFADEPNAKSYVGQSGFSLLEKSEVTFSTFKSSPNLLNKYKQDKERILYFPFIYQLLLEPDFIAFSNASLSTNISTEFILYNQKNKRYIHLGVDKHENTEDIYFPRTFLVTKSNKFVNNQQPIEILSKKMTLISDIVTVN